MDVQFTPKFTEAAPQTEPYAREIAQVAPSRSAQVIQALRQRVDKEAMGMVPSLAKEMAKNGWQADLDIFRLQQAARVGSDTLRTAIQAMARNNEYARQLIGTHPELEADVEQILSELNELIKQLPRVGVVAYTARYYQNGITRRDP